MFNKRIAISSCFLIILLLIAFIHLSPERSLRVYIAMMGYPKVALQTEFIEVTPEVAKTAGIDQNETLYELSNPPIEKGTEGELRYYAVEKVGIFYLPYFFGNF